MVDKTYHYRLLEPCLRNMATMFKVVLVLGPRQVGKSTLLLNVLSDLPVITFDQHFDEYNARSNPDAFLDAHPGPIILDEIQYMPELISAIKRRVDTSPKMGQYFLTGSQNLTMLRSIAESMAERVCILELGGMTQYEQAGLVSVDAGSVRPMMWLDRYLQSPDSLLDHVSGTVNRYTLHEAIWRGHLPRVMALPVGGVARYMGSYVNTYITRDVRLASQIDDIKDFGTFLRAAAATTAQEVNMHKIGKSSGIDGRKIKEWLQVLVQSYQWQESQPYTRNMTKRLSQKNKGYFADTGIACWLLQIPDPATLQGHAMFGALFETWVYNMLYQLLVYKDEAIYRYHWRTMNGAEVDVIIEYQGALYPIEIKGTQKPTRADVRGMTAFRKTYPQENIKTGLVIHAGTQSYRLDENTIAVPWNVLCK